MRNAKLFVGILIIGILAISACSKAEEQPTVGLEGVNDQVADRTIVDDETNATATLGVDFAGNLIYTNNNNLYVREQSTLTDPVLIAESVDTEHLYFSPDKKSIIYGIWPDDQSQGPIIHRTDLHTYENYKLAEFGWRYNDLQWVANSWSPDGEWVIVTGDGFPLGVGVVRYDGTYLRQVTQQQRNIVTWLADNRLMILNREWVGFESIPTITEIQVLNPTDNHREVFTVPEDLAQSVEGLQEIIARASLEPLNPEFINQSIFDDYNTHIIGNLSTPENDLAYRSRPLPTNTSPYCGTWEIYHEPTILAENETPEQKVVYEANDVGSLSDVQNFADGSLIFIKWTFPNCEFLQTPQGELIYLQADGTEIILADNLARLSDRNQIAHGATHKFHRYAIAPDGASIAWISSSENGRDTILHITDLATLETLDVESAINQEAGFNTVYWLQS